MESVFKGIESVKAGFGTGFYFLEGDYVVRVKRVFVKRSRQDALMFIVECAVLSSTNPQRPEGCEPNWVNKITGNDSALPNIKGFLAACGGADPTNEAAVEALGITSEDVDAAVSDENPLAGTLVKLHAFIKKTKKDTDFTVHDWSPVDQDWAPGK